jgi:hypothetical protein
MVGLKIDNTMVRKHAGDRVPRTVLAAPADDTSPAPRWQVLRRVVSGLHTRHSPGKGTADVQGPFITKSSHRHAAP